MSKSGYGAAHGYTIVELTVVMLIFSVVMTLISVSFSRMVRGSSHLLKKTETDIGGLIGLELMRSDVELAGFGLYWNRPIGASNYSEADDGLVLVNNCPEGCPNAKPALFDDRTYGEDKYVPRAYRVGNNVGYNGSDYLVLKGTALGNNKVSRGWGYLNYSKADVVSFPRDASSVSFKTDDRTIVLKSGMVGGNEVRELVLESIDKDADGRKDFSAFYALPFPEEFRPSEPGDDFLVYGVDKFAGEGVELRFPFNRADYYIDRPSDPNDISRTCAPGTGVLYKSVITQSGKAEECPILDCVADMQVVLYMDTNKDGVIDYHDDGEELDKKNALDTHGELKEIRVYILAQQGRRDDSYFYPVPDSDQAIVIGDQELMKNPDPAYGSIWSSSKMAATFGSNWRNYRWRLYTIVVQPKNL